MEAIRPTIAILPLMMTIQLTPSTVRELVVNHIRAQYGMVQTSNVILVSLMYF